MLSNGEPNSIPWGIEGKIALNEHTSLGDSGNTTKSTSFDDRRHEQHLILFFSDFKCICL